MTTEQRSFARALRKQQTRPEVDQDLDQVLARIVHALQPAPRSIVDSAALTPEAAPPTLSRSGEG